MGSSACHADAPSLSHSPSPFVQEVPHKPESISFSEVLRLLLVGMIERICVHKYHWCRNKDISDSIYLVYFILTLHDY